MNIEEIRSHLHKLIEEVYDVSIDELPTDIFQNIAIYAEATRTGLPMKNWRNYRIKKDNKGFTIADDLFITLLLRVEKLFNIIILDEEAEKIERIIDLENIIFNIKNI
jgi:hypothetical protein